MLPGGVTEMVARIHPRLHGFHVVFERDGQELDAEVTPTGERAVKAALMMLARLDALRDGDRLTCIERK
jgi:hypothetical protein